MNNPFQTLFGIEPDAVQKTCVIMPFDVPQAREFLGVKSLKNGRLFACGQGQGLTLIRSGMSAGFVGDCVLWLKDTPCQRIFFLGTCGLTETMRERHIGSVVTPATIYPFESFSKILTQSPLAPVPLQLTPEETDLPVTHCVCASFASLHEEMRFLPLFQTLGVEAVEMETHAFFLAARQIRRRSSALLVISDILGDKNFCFALSDEQKKSLAKGIRQACDIISTLVS